jgi:hypothetical protein
MTTEFTLFPSLPIEIRLKIIRTIVNDPSPENCWLYSAVEQFDGSLYLHQWVEGRQPAAILVNRECM